MRTLLRPAIVAAFLAAACQPQSQDSSAPDGGYAFVGGYPTEATVQRAYDDADLNRAIQSYKFFYPTMSMVGLVEGLKAQGGVANLGGGIIQATPAVIAFTANSDTPYGASFFDLTDGPWVIELPAGPMIGVANDFHFRWMGDLGLPGPDAGKGGKHLLVGPGYTGSIPSGYQVLRSTTNQAFVVVRSMPIGGDVPASIERVKSIAVHPLNPVAGAKPFTWVEITDPTANSSPQALGWDGTMKYWEALAAFVQSEPVFEGYATAYGDLAALGIEKGKPFAPDERMTRILTRAAQLADGQMRVQSLADRRTERTAWPDRKWEWVSLRPENGTWMIDGRKDMEAGDKWFYQATLASPAMFRRSVGAGSLYWLGLRDATGAYLTGGNNYKLTVPLPVPNRLFWSVTVYDAESRSEIITPQGKAALRSLFELKDLPASGSIDLYFGPTAPAGKEGVWVQTTAGRGWFAYFRIYGPEGPAFDGSWKPGDFEKVQ